MPPTIERPQQWTYKHAMEVHWQLDQMLMVLVKHGSPMYEGWVQALYQMHDLFNAWDEELSATKGNCRYIPYLSATQERLNRKLGVPVKLDGPTR